MADQVIASRWKKWVRRLLGLIGLASALGPAPVAASSDVEHARSRLEARVLAARQSLRHDGGTGTGQLTLGDKLAQWMNWPNWGNWGNWPNWNNWNNWGNWWNR